MTIFVFFFDVFRSDQSSKESLHPGNFSFKETGEAGAAEKPLRVGRGRSAAQAGQRQQDPRYLYSDPDKGCSRPARPEPRFTAGAHAPPVFLFSVVTSSYSPLGVSPGWSRSALPS